MRLVACGVLVVGLAPAVALASFDGLWNGRFGGVALDVLGTEVSLYQVSESHRWPLDRFTLDGEGRFQTGDGRRYRLTRDGERLDILDERDAVFLSFLPTVGLPPLREPTDDPAIVFDVFWEAFAENHALFDLTGVDWAAVRDSGREAAIAADGPDALFEVLSDLLAPLNDRHTTLVWPAAGRLYRSGRASDPFWQGRANTFLLNIAVNYLGRPLQSRLADPRLRFGILPGNVGYLYVADFLDGGALPSFATTLTLVLEELRDTDGLVVDLRFNPGGVDRNTRAFMEQLWPPDQQAAYFRERRLTGPLPGDFEAAELLRIAPRENAFYRRPIVFLTGGDTASAAETVLLAAVGLPRVVQIGEPSAGVFSNLLLRFFPNGWYSTLSNEQFYSLTGENYEQRGVPPHLPVAQSTYDLPNGVDAALDAALLAVAAQPEAVETPRSPGLAATGLWYDPARDGEGWHLQRISDTQVFATFYGYAPDGSGAGDWVVGLGTERDGVLELDALLSVSEGPGGLEASPWGHGEIRFGDCEQAVATLSGPGDYRGFTYRLQRLSRAPGLGCGGSGAVRDPSFAGSWYDPERSGEGWLLTPVGAREWVATGYLVDSDARRWVVGTGSVEDDGVLRFPALVAGQGAAWGHGFTETAVERQAAGALSVELDSCGRASFMLSGQNPSGETPQRLSRLTPIAGLAQPDCD